MPRAGRRWYCQEGADTRGLMAAQALDALGPRESSSNLARGSIVDEAALIRELQANLIAGAGRDAFEHEPDIPPARAGSPPPESLGPGCVAIGEHLSANTAHARGTTLTG
ncbi:NAD(P)-dependent oxidoreductase [Myxococcus sp. AB025B]|uniref:NAD(P)-dependent oxidoreductase n=1 Tax=Myxococcus sp. AB025B TaxID=2562794 RepID=UPI001E40C991|nr:NAD(P)-dependent oxidoreductase [Myxococcus sp. AB025B]